VVIWNGDGDSNGDYDVLGQRFDANGAAIGSEFQVSNTSPENPPNFTSSVTSLDDGDFLVTWAEFNYSGSGVGQVLAQRFDAGISVSSSSSSSSSSQVHGFSAEVGTGTDACKVILTGPTVAASVSNGDGARETINAIDNAIKTVNIQRSKLGAVSNRLSHTVNNLTNISSNLSAAQGGIEDADFAKETTDLAKNQILQQASTAMLAQANASKQNVLSLLQG
jgi:flagellin